MSDIALIGCGHCGDTRTCTQCAYPLRLEDRILSERVKESRRQEEAEITALRAKCRQLERWEVQARHLEDKYTEAAKENDALKVMVAEVVERMKKVHERTVDPAPTTMSDRKVLDWVHGQSALVLASLTQDQPPNPQSKG